MKSSLGRRFAATIAMACLLASLVLVVVPSAALAGTSDPGACPFADSFTATECVISSPWTIGGGGVGANNFPGALPGPFDFHKTLHITNTGAIRAIGTAGITLTIDGAVGGTGALIMDAGASVIDTNEDFVNNPPNAGAGPLTISATGGAALAAGSTLRAENTSQGGDAGPISLTLGASSSLAGTISSQALAGTTNNSGGDITITVTGDLVLAGTSVISSAKSADHGEAGDITITVSGDMTMQAGALISAEHPGASDGYPGGNITIAVGTGDQGTFTMESGSRVDSSSQGFAGNIKITAGLKIDIQVGASVLAGQIATEDTRGHGGRIFLISGCDVEVAGTVSSQGEDPGADLVHLEGCLVHIASTGLVESTGHAHQPATPTSCDSTDDDNDSRGGDAGEVLRPGHPDESSVCVEIWARHVVIDAGGEVNADFALAGGTDGHGWIDIFAESDVTIAGPASGTKYAVHSNSGLGNDIGGDITIKAKNSFATFSGNAVQANATANGGSGGHVIAEAGGNVVFDGASLQALGSQGTNAGHLEAGGSIEGRSYQGTLTGALPGELNTAAFDNNGLVKLQSCLGTTYTGFTAPGALSVQPDDCLTLTPSFPTYADGPIFSTTRWDRCGQSSISGTKFEDTDGDGIWDVGELGLGGWTIHVTGPNFDQTVVTDSTPGPTLGTYTIVVPGGATYQVCEVLQVGWIQTFPTSGGGCANGEGANGYSVPVNVAGPCCEGQQVTGKDFGNFKLGSKSGTKFLDSDNDGTAPFNGVISGWRIHLLDSGGNDVFGSPKQTAADGTYSFTGLTAGTYTVCEETQANWNQTFPSATATDGTVCDLKGYAAGGYTFSITSGKDETGNDFANFQRPVQTPPTCPEDPNRAALLTRTVDLNKGNLSGGGVAGNPRNYWTVQAAYDAAKVSGQTEVIGLFANTNENLLLDGSKSLTITQCTLARVTGAAGSPVWNITSTGKLTIIGPDAVGGSIGWRVAGNGGHTLKSVRANGATIDGILITSNGNSVSWNDVSGNGNGTATAAGIRVEGGTNILKGGTVGSNNGDGVQLIGNSNQLSGATIQSNTGNGVCVAGSTNKVTSNSRINLNGKNGILVTGSTNTVSSNASESGKGNVLNGILVSSGTGNQLTDNKLNSNGQAGINVAASTGTKLKSNANANNTGNEFTIGSGNVDQTGNKKNGSGFTFTSAGGNFN